MSLPLQAKLRSPFVLVPFALGLAGAASAGAAFVGAQAPPETPAAVVRDARRAVEGDSVARVRTRWEQRLRTSAGDPVAALGLATLSRFTYEHAAAERRYRDLLAAGRTKDDRWALYARLGLAEVLDTRRQMGPADSLYTRVVADARALGDSAAEGSALWSLFTIRANTVGITEALPTLERAGLVLPRSEPHGRAMQQCMTGMIRTMLGRPGDAELARGLAIAREGRAPTAEGGCLRYAGVVARIRGATDSSLALFRSAAAVQRRAHDRYGLSVSLANIGQIETAAANLGTARAAMLEALREGEASGDSAMVGGSLLGLAQIAQRAGDRATAADLLARAVTMFQSFGDVDRVSMARGAQAELAADAGDLAAAREGYLVTLEWTRKAENHEDEVVALRSLFAISLRQRDWKAAERELAGAEQVVEKYALPHFRDDLAYDRGRLALARGELSAAERALRDALRRHEPGQHFSRHETRARLAEVYARRGELARAEQELTGAAEAFDAWRATLEDRELRLLAFEARLTAQSELGASVATTLAALARGGRAEAAFHLAERRRARELADRLIQAASLRDAGAAGTPAPLDAQAHAHAHEHARPATAREAAAALPDDGTALVTWVTGGDDAPATVFVVTRMGLAAHVLPDADSLAGRVSRFVALLEGGGDPRALATTLGAALVEPAVRALPAGVTRLVLMPDGPLHRLPFDALRLADGRYVAERYTVVTAPSAAVVAALWRRGGGGTPAAAHPAPRILAFGDPAFAGEGAAATGDTRILRDAFGESGGLVRLAGSGREARSVARFAPEALVRLRDEASEAFLKRSPLDGFSVIHFATHALVDEASVARTALALAPGGGEDGFVAPGDLAALHLDADLVVLSACRTAGGVVVAGEGVRGLATPLLEAGARSIVATQWQVPDEGTVRLIDDFYGALARGLPVGDALRDAKLAALRRGAPPREWAAFTLVGDPLVRVPLLQPAPERRWAWGAAGAAGVAGVLLAGLWAVRKRRPRAA